MPLTEQNKTTPETELPERAIRFPDLTIGGKTPKQLENALASDGFRVGDQAIDMLRNRDFTTLPEQQVVNLVKARLSDLGLTPFATLSQILERASNFGLGECPAEIGPHLRLALKDQPLEDWFSIAMKPIADSSGDPSVFGLGRGDNGLWLGRDWARPDTKFPPGRGFVFSVRK